MLLRLIWLFVVAGQSLSCTEFVKTHTIYMIQSAAHRSSTLFYTLYNGSTVQNLNELYYGQNTSTHYWFLSDVKGMNNTYNICSVLNRGLLWTAIPEQYAWDARSVNCLVQSQLIHFVDTVDGSKSNACILTTVPMKPNDPCCIYEGEMAQIMDCIDDCSILSDGTTLRAIRNKKIFYFDEVKNAPSYDLYGSCLDNKAAQCRAKKVKKRSFNDEDK